MFCYQRQVAGVAALPNFFVVGVPKAGTTSLYHYLGQHPQIYMSPIKEPTYFADELRPENFGEEMRRGERRARESLREYLDGPMTARGFGLVTEWPDYLKLFRNVNGQTAIGEASVTYLWSPSAVRSIASKIPAAKIVMILRDPAARAFSQYLYYQGIEPDRRSFRDYVDAALRNTDKVLGRLYPFLEFGQYYEQVRRYREAFPSENIRVYFYENYRRDAPALLRDLFGFLSVDETFAPDMTKKQLEPRVPRFPAPFRLLKRSGLWLTVKNVVQYRQNDRVRICRRHLLQKLSRSATQFPIRISLPFLLRFGGGDARNWFAPLGSAHLARPIRVSRKQPIRSYGRRHQRHHHAAGMSMLSATKVARSCSET